MNKRIKLRIDILDYIIGEILSVEYTNKRWRLIAYILKLLNEIEHNYKIHNKEILAMIRKLEI